MSSRLIEKPRQWVKTRVEKVRERIIPPLEEKPLMPVIRWDINPQLQAILDNPQERLAVGSVVAAGHMPNGFSDEQLAAVRVFRNSEGMVEDISRGQIQQLHKIKKGLHKDGPFRFIDTKRNIIKQEEKLYKKLKKIYDNQKRSGATKVLFSVCAISAGFDLNYANALLRVMDEVGKENIVFSIFLPFSRDSATSYSVAGQGVNPQYWEKQWRDLQDKAAGEYAGSIFIHEPKLIAYDGKSPVSENSPSHTEAHERGTEINGKANSVYSDVNRQLVTQAMRAVKWNMRKVQGIFAESFLTSKALLGGGPEIMAMLLQAGVPLRNLNILQQGLTERKHFFGRHECS